MLVPKANRLAVYKAIFQEGVMVAPKDFNLPKHKETGVPNLHVIKLMQSFKSRGYVRESFSWGWFYWYLTNEGIEYLREYLHLPAEIVPATLKKSTRAPTAPRGMGGPRREGGEGRGRFGDRDNYRRDGDKKEGPGSDFRPDFRGSGRGGRGGFAARQ